MVAPLAFLIFYHDRPRPFILPFLPNTSDKICYQKLIAISATGGYAYSMNKAHRNVFDAIFSVPVPTTLEWRRVEALFVALGAQTIEGGGSRVRFHLNGVIATFHRPHPAKEAKPYQIRDARTFLENAGVKP
jgi:hypothetical protein